MGAYRHTNGQTYEGRAFVYYGSEAGLGDMPTTRESDLAEARFGFAVGTAGDVNSDGYSDVIIGAYGYNSGLGWGQGRAYVYYGSSSGLGATPWIKAGVQAYAYFGHGVGTAGDVNGDGYSDVIVGSHGYDGGQIDEGRAYVYHGSASGLQTNAAWTVESNKANTLYGASVGAAGDVNGDGYGDVLVGANRYDGPTTDEGRAYLYYGNDGPGLALRPRQLRVASAAAIAPLGASDAISSVRLGLLARSPLGREDVKMEWQVAPLGVHFTATTGVISGVSPSWVDALPGGMLVTQTVDGLAEDTAYHWRTRLVYRPGNRLGQPAGRWIHGAWNGQQETDFRTVAVISPTWRVISYTYDPLGRLTEADYSTGERFEYAYDEVGNRVAATVTLGVVGTPEVANYVYDDANRLTSVDGQTYIWDDNGNLTSGGGKTYSYNQANRLTGVSGSGLAWSAAYNGDGARLSQTANGQVVSYTLDLATPLVTVLAERAGDDTTYYLYGQSTRPLAQYNPHLGEGEWTHFLPDGLGSVRIETDGAGEVTAWRAFEPYGAPLAGDGGAPFGFTGEMWDDDTELVFLRARYYDPGTGRFFQQDPSGLERNLFVYATSNPINRVDPSGYLSTEIIKNSVNPPSLNGIFVSEWGKLEIPTVFEWSHQPFSGLLMALKVAKPGDRLKSGQLIRDGDGLKVEWTQEWTIGCKCDGCRPEIVLSRGRGWVGNLVLGPDTKSFRKYLEELIGAQYFTYLGGYTYHKLDGDPIVYRDGGSLVPDLLASDYGQSFPLPPDSPMPTDPSYVWGSSVDRHGNVYKSGGWGVGLGPLGTVARGAIYMGEYPAQSAIATADVERAVPLSEDLRNYWEGWSTVGGLVNIYGWTYVVSDEKSQVFSAFSRGISGIGLARVWTEQNDDKQVAGWDTIESNLGIVRGVTWDEAVNHDTYHDNECQCGGRAYLPYVSN